MTAADLLLPLPVVVPILAAALNLLATGRLVLQRTLSIVTCISTVGIAVALAMVTVSEGGVVATEVGAWPVPLGISLVADRLAAGLLVVATVVVLGILVYALGERTTEDERTLFHPTYLVLLAGVSAAFLTGDLFNLFVSFEVMLTASYVLLVIGGTAGQVNSGMTYVVISLTASTLFVVAVALVYAATGTVNLADLAGRLAELDDPIRDALSLLLLVVFGIKAAVFPLFFWLPDAYPTTAAPITAVFAALLTKVGVYAIIRTQTLLFPHDGPSPLLLWAAGLTMVIGVLGALAQNEIKRILSFTIISHIGYSLMGLALFSVAGVAAAVFYLIQDIVTKTCLFLAGGLIESSTGSGSLTRLSGLLRRLPWVAALFALSALTLAGIPPFSGFLGKLALVQAGLEISQVTIVFVSLVVSLLTVLAMGKIWAGAFWGPLDVEGLPDDAEATISPPRVARLATGGLLVVSLAVALFAGPLASYSRAAAEDLLRPEPYLRTVLEGD